MNIVSFSGGKDSTAMLLMMLEKGVKVDRIISVDTTKEFPQMYEHIKKIQVMIEPLKIEIVKIDYDYWFSEHILSKGKNIGKSGYGWPSSGFRWCTGMKMDAIRACLANVKYNPRKRNYRSLKAIGNNKMFIAYAIDEAKRAKTNDSLNEIYPLIEWEITEKQALEYCYSKGLDWGGLYEKMYRVSCWCCPLSRIGELRVLYNEFPELWKELQLMDTKTFRRFRNDYSVQELSNRFANERDLYELP
jgi:3'-phosphoadenosine 5'-phosphosulfate sulfotransferase (PAPS reductase)/FAD synthetase